MGNGSDKGPQEMNRIEEALKKTTDTRACVIADGALAGLADMFKASFPGATAAILVADPRTWKAAGEKSQAILEAAGTMTTKHIVEPGGAHFHSEYHYAAEVREAISSASAHLNIQTLVPVAIGSGVINDLTKRASGELGIGYMVVATAASVDGYSSFGAALVTPEGAKQTYACPAPRAILADIGVTKEFVLGKIDFAMLMRNRYNLLDLLFRVGKLHLFSDDVLNFKS